MLETLATPLPPLVLCEHLTVPRRLTERGDVLIYGITECECLEVRCLICGATARAGGVAC